VSGRLGIIASLGKAVVEGDWEEGVFLIGQAAALIKEEMTVANLFRQMTQEAEGRLQGLVALMKEGARR
jgi:NAD(P)H-dependent flavin oxidoreductase YrpB (nitropropane dioxygenase family)